ncbi:MAG TPA: TolC family protein [Bryobacteraceae bacterium]
MTTRRIAATLVYSLSFSSILQAQDTIRETIPRQERTWHDRFTLPYMPTNVHEPSFTDSPRLHSLLRGGKLYLSLDDAIALAIENNLDVELQRYSFPTADSDVLRAKGGGAIRGLPLSVNLLPQGIGGPQSPLLNLPASGSTPTTTVATSLAETAAIVPSQTSPSITTGAPSAGSPIPQFDPALTGSITAEHQSVPEANELVAGTSVLTTNSTSGNIGLTQGFSTGTSINAGFNSLAQLSNSSRNTYNGYASSNLGLTVTQPLLRGFGPAVNRRYIRIARNNQKASDLLFRQQAIETVAGVIRLYYDLVSLIDDVEVKRQTLATAQKLYEDNQSKVDQGTLAPIELVRAQAQVAAARQDLANSDGFELQQELIVKTLLSRMGTTDPLLRDARVIPTTPIEVPGVDATPSQEYVEQAFRNRPELQGGRLQIENTHIAMEGTRNEMKPELDLVGTLQNAGLGGQANPLAGVTSSGISANPSDPALTGGFGSSLEQILRHNYPTYAVGIQLNLPLRNRIAEADYIRDETQLRQSQIRFQQLQNQIRMEVESSIVALAQARAAYEAAVEARKLQEQSLEIENEKFANGLSTNFLILQYQSYVAQARSTEVSARGTYAKARTALDRATGRTLENHNVAIDEVQSGTVSRPPSAIPTNVTPGTPAAGRP